MKKVRTNNGNEVSVLSVSEVANDVLRYEFQDAFRAGNLDWKEVALKDSEYVMMTQRYIDNQFSQAVANTLNLFESDLWKEETKKNFGFNSDVNYIKNAFDCDTYASFHKMMAHVAIAQHYPELGAAPAFGTISYISGGSAAEQTGVAHEINFYICKRSDGRLGINYFEPQEIYAGRGKTINLTQDEISTIFAVRI